MSEEKKGINIKYLVCIVVAAALVGSALAPLAAYGEPVTYQFQDDSICPCLGNRVVLDENCNKIVAELLEYYDEVSFCKGANTT